MGRYGIHKAFKEVILTRLFFMTGAYPPVVVRTIRRTESYRPWEMAKYKRRLRCGVIQSPM